MIAIIIPYHNTPDALQTVLRKIPTHLHEHTLIIDDGSLYPPHSDIPLGISVHTHPICTGYGSSQKTGFTWVLQRMSLYPYTQILLVHGDDQYAVETILQATNPLYQVQLGSRILWLQQNSIQHREQHMPTWRYLGNRLLTTTANSLFQTTYTDLHTGARIYHTEFIQSVPFHTFRNDFVFDQQMLAHCLATNISIHEFPIAPDYRESVSSISFRRSIHYGVMCLRYLWAAKRTAI